MGAADRVSLACRVGVAVGLLPFLAILWDVGWNPLRTAYADGLNSDFFDLQGRALLDGRLDVAAGSLGIEAFVRDGHHYMYFGPFPALLRLPVLLVTDRLDGRLTAVSMLVGWAVLAAALCRLVRSVRGILAGDGEASRFEAALLGLLVATSLGGSSLVFLASQPWVYNEVYVWSAALSIVIVDCLVATWRSPTARGVAATTAAATALILTRATAGWAFALALVAAGAWQYGRRADASGRVRRRLDLSLAAGGVLAAAIGSAVNWAKFRHIVRFPIELHEWTRVSVHRQLVLLQNGGRIDGPQFFWTDLVAYFRPDGIRFVPYFPFITFPASPPTAVWGVHLDESFRTGSVTAFMPLLVAGALWGLVTLAQPLRVDGVGALRLGAGACVLATGGVMAFGYVAPRYTAEFVPGLAVLGVVAAVDAGRRLGSVPGCRGRRLRRGIAVGAALLTAFGVAANSAVGLSSGRRTARGEGLVSFVDWQARISSVTGNPLDDLVRRADEVPDDGPADQLLVVGDCDAIYLATGETNAPWVAVAIRPHDFELRVGDDPLPEGVAVLMDFEGTVRRRLGVEADSSGRVRLRVDGAAPVAGGWIDAPAGSTVSVSVIADTAHGRYSAVATSRFGTSRVEVPLSEWDRALRSMPVTAAPTAEVGPDWTAAGAVVSHAPGERPALCERLVE